MTNEKMTHVNRTYKSTVFTMLSEDRNNLLELYNAMSGNHYTDPELLEINTLGNAIYMCIKNDVSFIIDGRLSLYEHQSTYSPNLPLRFLFYVSHLYAGITNNANLYGTKAVDIPAPEFVIFYNGTDEMPEYKTLRLSDLYSVKDKECGLELKAKMLNICGNNNTALKRACRTLGEYAVFTDKMRNYAKMMNIEDAADRTIDECIREGILEDFLRKHKMEAKSMSIFEYDQEKHLRMEREEALEEGRKAATRSIITKMLQEGYSRDEIIKICSISDSELEKYCKD